MSHSSSVSLLRLAATFLATSGALSTVLLGCGATDALVGGECGPGFAQCDYQCVDLANDPDNCGACGTVCGGGESCVASSCVAPGADPRDSGITTAPDGAASGSVGATGLPPADGGGVVATGDAGSVGPRGSGDAGAPSPVDGGATSDAPSGDAQVGDAQASDAGDAQVSDAQPGDAQPGDAGDAQVGDASNGSPEASSTDDAGSGSTADDAGSGTTAEDAAAPDGAANECLPPFDTAAHCGDCATTCSGTNDTCVATDGGFACAPLCSAPLTECSGQCFDEQTDPNNCGACGKICLSGLCSAGLCEGATPGDDIVIGHDYISAAPGTAQARALSNAVLLPSSNPVRILSFEQYADPTAVARVKAILAAAAAAEGKSIQLTVSTNDSDVPSMLGIATFDTLLVYDQAQAPPGTLTVLGTSWAPTLALFLGAGGDVVTLDGAAGTTAEMPLFETSAGLLSIASHTSITPGTPLSVIAPGDSVALGVLNPYGATGSSAHFSTLEASGENVTYVVVDPSSGEPVIVHKTVEKVQRVREGK